MLVGREQHHSSMEDSGCCEHGSGTHRVLQMGSYHQLLLPRGDFPPSKAGPAAALLIDAHGMSTSLWGVTWRTLLLTRHCSQGSHLGASIDVLGTGQALQCMRAAGCTHRLQLSALIHVAISASLKHGVICREKKPTLTFSMSFC